MITLKQIFCESSESSKSKIDAIITYIRDIISSTEFKNKIFICGGYVRDELLGLDAKDLDLIANMDNGGIVFAEWITKKSGNYKAGSNPVIYPRFGTAKFNLNGVKYNNVDLSNYDIEVVMPRSEEYTGGSRKPDVKYTNLQAEAERRDLTVNALFKNISNGEIIDLTGKGLNDLRMGIARPPLDPDTTFSDDPLRMLRLVRQSMKYKWNVPKNVLDSVKKNAHKLQDISSERIMEELNKILLFTDADQGIRLLSNLGLMQYIMPELDELRGLEQSSEYHHEDAYDHSLSVLKNMPPTIIKRLAGLLHDIGKKRTAKFIAKKGHVIFYGHAEVGARMVRDILTKLKYPNNIVDSVADLVYQHMFSIGSETPTEKATRKLLNNLKSDVDDLIDLINADRILSHETGNTDITKNRRFVAALKAFINKIKLSGATKTKFPINGNDIMITFGLEPSKKIGDLMNIAKEFVYENPSATKEQVLNHVRENQ